MKYNPTPEQEKLAKKIAAALDDINSLQWHRKTVTMYSEEYLLGKLNKVLAMPESKITTTRPRLYVWLVQNNG
jgi:hypothetical protein